MDINIIENLWPFLVLQLILVIAALFDLWKQKQTRNLTPFVWVLIILFVNFLGSVLYFTIGRNED